MFIVSQDLEFFIHDHPVLGPGGNIPLRWRAAETRYVPRTRGCIKIHRTPQLTAKSIFVPGGTLQPLHLTADLSAKPAANMQVEPTEPRQPIAGLNIEREAAASSRPRTWSGTWARATCWPPATT